MLDTTFRVSALVLPNQGGPEATSDEPAGDKTRAEWIREHVDALGELAQNPARGGPVLPHGCTLHHAGPLVPPRISPELSAALLACLRQQVDAAVLLITTPALSDPQLRARLEIAVRQEAMAQPHHAAPKVIVGSFSHAEPVLAALAGPPQALSSSGPPQTVADLRAGVDELLAHGPSRMHPPAAQVQAAIESLRQGTGGGAEMEVLLHKAVQDARSVTGISMWGCVDPARNGTCGPGADAAALSLASLLSGAGVSATIRRYQADDAFGTSTHAFCTVQFHGNGEPDRLYLMDSTYAQFFAHSQRQPEQGNVLLQDREDAGFVHTVLARGFIELTPDNASRYARGLAVPASESLERGSVLLRGDRALTTDLVGGPQALAIGRRSPEQLQNARLINIDFADDLVSERLAQAIDQHERWGDPYGEAQQVRGLQQRLEAVLARP